jgi:hypothetical protein
MMYAYRPFAPAVQCECWVVRQVHPRKIIPCVEINEEIPFEAKGDPCAREIEVA